VLGGCADAAGGSIEATGTVSDQAITVSAPVLPGHYQQLREVHPLGRITAGESLAVIEDRQLRAEAEASAAALDAATARIAELDSRAKEIDDAEAEAEKKSQAQQSSSAANTKLRKQAEQLAELISKLQRCVSALRQQLADLPGTTAYTEVRKSIQREVSYFSGELSKAQSSHRQVKAKLDSTVDGDTGLTQAEKADFAKQREQVAELREAAVAAKEAAKERQSLAADQLALTTVTAPVSGTIVQIGELGQVVQSGAPLAVIHPDQPTQVTAWIPTGDHARLCLGTAAIITGDWMAAGESVSGSIVSLGGAARYPPTPTSGDDIRPLRAIEITIEAATELPAGLPVDITLDPESSCHG
jgi:multidrug resistance efflux pump